MDIIGHQTLYNFHPGSVLPELTGAVGTKQGMQESSGKFRESSGKCPKSTANLPEMPGNGPKCKETGEISVRKWYSKKHVQIRYIILCFCRWLTLLLGGC